MRRNFYLTAVCGTAIAMTTPAVALGQNTQQPRETQTRQARTATPQTADTRDPASILRRLEGLWKIEVRVNEALWNMNMRADDANWSRPDATSRNDRDTLDRENRTTRDLDDRDQNRPDIDREPVANPPEVLKPVGDRPEQRHNVNDPEHPTTNPTDRTTTDRTTTNRNTGDQPEGIDNLRSVSEADHTRMVAAKTMHGVAQTRVIMGGKILQQRAFIENGMVDSSSGADQDRREGAARVDASDSMQTLSYISFDEDRGTYSAVFMCDEKGMMHFDSGRYEAATNRIVFDGRDAAYGSPSYRGHDGDATGADPINRDADGQLREGYTDRSYPETDGTPASTTERDKTDADRLDRENEVDRRDAAQRDAEQRDAQRPAADRDTITTQPRSTDSDRVSRGPEDKPVYVVAPSHGNDLDNVSVVLELLGDDRYRVTMYQGSAMHWNAGDMEGRVNANPNDRDPANRNVNDRDTTDRDNLDRDNLDRHNLDRDNLDRDNPDRDAADRDLERRPLTDPNRRGAQDANMIPANVVYQATFTRATGSDESSYRQLFDNADRD